MKYSLGSARVCVWIIVLLTLAGCAGSTQALDSRSREEYLIGVRMCIAGAMPMEVRFDVDGNPPVLRNETLLLSDIDLIIGGLDGTLKSIFGDAMTTVVRSPDPGSSKIHFESLIWDEFVWDLVVQVGVLAGHRQGISYCGDSSAVTVSYWSRISEYFGRALWREDGSRPAWTTQAGGQATSVLMVGVALRIAGVEFDPGEIIRAANK